MKTLCLDGAMSLDGLLVAQKAIALRNYTDIYRNVETAIRSPKSVFATCRLMAVRFWVWGFGSLLP